ncbi:hypothetical protein P691DRAFT_803238 [Macrolepiota fuliginosa MF-IS2]|uniref:Uncharacterized protein n=1 Tax=Macrolepiota fuliginosa MF-IS2 TaxID=1400762 RepID=A0A9P5XCA4_9AGAR|nr:hypothetical protein P691DRAFT_803238 [Macrolepiota fuliginosa MF-IS2]
MVDPDFDPSSPPQDVPLDVWTPTPDDFSPHAPPLQVVSNDTLAHTPPANSRSSYIPSPSPLRNQHNPEASLSKSTLQSTASAAASTLVKSASQSSQILPQPGPPSRPTLPPAAAPVKRVVRFVEDDAEDTEPLYLVRQKKKREEKAKFLRTEQRKRLMEQEQERRRLEAEAMEQERKRLAKEREDREMEQQQYTEAVAAARLRRETQRAGIIPGLKTDSNNNLLLPSPSTSSLRGSERNRSHESRRSSLMPHHTGSSSSIPRREASDSALSRSYPHSFETSSYRTGSGGYSPAGSNSGHGHTSRPGSMYSSSSEDGRASNKRLLASNNNTRPLADRATSHPARSGSNSSLHNAPHIPNVPRLPELMNDSVLLPPSAPFMMHQHPRQSRNSSPGRSTSSGSLRGTSVNSSSERVSMHRQSSHSRETYSAPSSPGTSPSLPTHVKNGSGDSRRASMPVHALPRASVSTSQTTSTRGRPQIHHAQTMHGMQYLQAPNPWTALPMQYGTSPMAMPVLPYSHSPNLNTLSKASFPSGSTKAKGGAKRQTIV